MLEKVKYRSVIEKIATAISEGKNITNFDLLEICRQKGIGESVSKGKIHLTHELLEVAVNHYISKLYCQKTFSKDYEISRILVELDKIEKQIPVKSWRSTEQQGFQQFSTPPTIAFLMASLLNPSAADLILEPSAGTGSLVVWLKLFGCKLQLNEISDMRRTLLELQGFQPTAYNAEFLDDLMPAEIAPDGVLMNPPFSSSGSRTKTGDSGFGFRHIRSALSRLKIGGKLVCLLGTQGGFKTGKSQKFWSEIAEENELKAFIHLPQNAFYKYGTTIATTIICLTKGKPTKDASWSERRSNILEVNCARLEDCLEHINIFGS